MESSAALGQEQRLAYLLLRVIAGMDFFGHGFARIFTGTHLSGFAHWMVGDMAKAPLPPSLVLLTGFVVPWVELLVGLALLFGYGVRFALVTAMLLMLLLMFGVTLKQDWTVAGQQLLYSLVLGVLLFGRAYLDVSWSGLLRRR
jgi:thiosulfate dehydrogenase (quinone) large subunit